MSLLSPGCGWQQVNPASCWFFPVFGDKNSSFTMRKAVGTVQRLGEKSADQNGKTSALCWRTPRMEKRKGNTLGWQPCCHFAVWMKQVKQEFIGKGRYSPTCSRNEVPAHLFWMVNSRCNEIYKVTMTPKRIVIETLIGLNSLQCVCVSHVPNLHTFMRGRGVPPSATNEQVLVRDVSCLCLSPTVWGSENNQRSICSIHACRHSSHRNMTWNPD